MTLLGTGTSQGVPVIGCQCPVCTSTDPRDQRLRTAAYIRYGDTHLAIDCGPDFRQQMLRAGVSKLSAVLLTHEHNDHIIGLDDVRPFNFMAWKNMPVYAVPRVQAELHRRFSYVFATENRYPGAPMVELLPLDKGEQLRIDDLEITPVEVMHGSMPVLGFRFGPLAYLTDIKSIREEELAKLTGIEHLVLGVLHHKPHHSHLNMEEGLALIERIRPQHTYLIHCSHHMGLAAEVNPTLPTGVQLGYDGQVITVTL